MNNMLTMQDLIAFWLTIKLAGISTLLLLVISIPLAWWLAHTRWRGKIILEVCITLPLILPPTVLGFYLLMLFSPNYLFGQTLSTLASHVGIERIAFSFTGLVIGSIIYSLPFVAQPIINAFRSIGTRPIEIAATCGISRFRCIMTLILPMAKPAILTATVLGFAHTLGEFGVILMIGGNIEGETKVLSIAIYEHVESLNYLAAHQLSLVLLILSFVTLLGIYSWNRQFDLFATHR